MDLKELIRTFPDFPEKGILFRDITTPLKEPEGLQEALHQMQDAIKDMEYDVIVGPESRGFIFGVPLAYVEKKGFVPVRNILWAPFRLWFVPFPLHEQYNHRDRSVPGRPSLHRRKACA